MPIEGSCGESCSTTSAAKEAIATASPVLLNSPVIPSKLHDRLTNVDCRGFTDEDVRILVDRCPQVQYLKLGPFVSGADNRISDDSMVQLQSLTNLKALRITGAHQITDKGMELLGYLPALQTLTLSDCAKLTGACLRHIINPSQLMKLSLSGWRRGIREDDIDYIKHMDQLETLQMLGSTYEGSGNGLIELLLGLERLRVLNLNGCRVVTDAVVRGIIPGIQGIEKLGLSATGITNATLGELATLPRLRALDVRNCKGVSRPAVQELKETRPTIIVQF